MDASRSATLVFLTILPLLGSRCFVTPLRVEFQSNPAITSIGVEIDLSVLVEPKENTLCVMYIGDDNCSYIMTPTDFRVQLSETFFGGSVGYVFKELGIFNNTVSCENSGEIIRAWSVIEVQEELEGLEMSESHGVRIVNKVNRGIFNDIHVNFTFIAGTSLNGSYSIDFGPKIYSNIFIDEEAKAGFLNIRRGEIDNYLLHTVAVTISNFHGSDNFTVDVINTEVIESVRLSAAAMAVIDVAVVITAISDWGSSIEYLWTVNGKTVLSSMTPTLNHAFASIGEETIFLNASNQYGFEVANTTVDVVNPVLGFQVNLVNSEDVFLQAPQPEFFPMGNLSVELSSGDSKQESIAITISPLTNITLTSHLPPNSVNIIVRIFSDVSEQTLTLDKPANFDLEVSSEVVETNTKLDISLANSAGARFSYVIEFGDGKMSSDSLVESLQTDLVLSHIYSSEGTYRLQINITKEGITTIRGKDVVVQNPLPNFSFSTVASVALSDGPVTFSLMAEHHVNDPTNASCSLDYGDESPAENLSWDRATSGGISHLYEQPGRFGSSIVCKNGISSIRKSWNITVHKFSYHDFKILYNKTVALNSSDKHAEVPFTIRLLDLYEVPSGVKFAWDFGDNTPVETDALTTWVKTHNYTSRGNFNITINITTGNSWGVLSLPIKIGIFTISARRTTGAVQRDAFTINVFGDVGEAANYMIDFGDGQIKQDSLHALQTDFVYSTSVVYQTEGIYLPRVTVWNTEFVESQIFDEGFTAFLPVEGLLMNMEPSITEQSSGSRLYIRFPDSVKKPQNVSCSVNFGDNGELLTFRLNATTNFSQGHEFKAVGQLTVQVNCSNTVSYQSETLLITVITHCYGSVRPFGAVESPLRKLVSQQLTLTANPDIYCTNMTAEFLWSVDQVTNNSDSTVPIAQPNSTVLVLGARTMKPVTYRITFYTNFKELPSSYSSDSVIVIYEETDLIARIKGGTLKTTGVSWPTILDALTFSRDPDSEPSSSSNQLLFQWSYGILDTKQEVDKVLNGSKEVTPRRCPSCLRVNLKPQGVIVLTPGCLAVGHWHVFTVNVSKWTRSAQYTQIIHVVSENPPQVDIRCKVNCFTKVNAEFSFSLQTECLDCTQEEMAGASYSWTLYQKNGMGLSQVSDFPELTSTGTSISTLSVRPNTLITGMPYSVTLQIDDMKNHSRGQVTLDFVVNYPPYNGTCFIQPETGYAALDSFYLECQGWVDEGASTQRSRRDTGEQLQYQFLLLGGATPSLIYAGDSRRTPSVELSPGMERDDYRVLIIAKIFDTNNGMAEFNISARVVPPLKRHSAITNQTDVTRVIEQLDTRLDRAVITGDIATVSRVTRSSASVLNVLVLSEENSSASADPESWLSVHPNDLSEEGGSAKPWTTFWKDLLGPADNNVKANLESTTSRYTSSLSKTLDAMNVTSTDIVYHVADSLTTIMEKPSRVPDDALTSAGNTLDKLGNSLVGVVDDGMSDTQVTGVLDAMLNSVGGVMKAAFPEESLSDGVTSVQDALQTIINSRTYAEKAQDERFKDADLQDEERAFLFFRNIRQKIYLYKRRHKLANLLVGQLNSSVDRALDAASVFLVSGQEPLTFSSSDLSASVGRNALHRFLKQLHRTGGVTLHSQPPGDRDVDKSLEIKFKTTIYNRNPFSLNTSRDKGQSPVIQIGFVREDQLGQDEGGLPNISLQHLIAIPVSQHIPFTNTSPKYIPLDRDQLLYRRLELSSTTLSIVVYLRPSLSNIEYDVFFRSKTFPTASSYDYKTHSVDVGQGNRTQRAVCPGNTLPLSGTVYIGLKPKPMALKHKRKTNAPESLEVYEPMTADSVNFSQIMKAEFRVGMVTLDCTSWTEDFMDSDACTLSDTSTLEETVCACDHPIQSVLNAAQSFIVPVNQIDFSTVFAKIDLQNNSSVFACVLTLLAIYMILAVWARRKDQADVLKWGITSLADNHMEDRYLYIVTVYTGMRIGAGTNSRVGFAIVGEEGDTGIRLLNDGIRQQIPSRSIMHFLMAVPTTLGYLQYMRIWHDNSGQGDMASWFLHKVVVEDLQTDRRYIFKCGRWLAVEEDDGLIERLLPVSAKEDLVTFKGVFYNNTRKNFTDSHLWFSVILRPQRSQFTRFQRLSCCLCLLFLTMLSNAMFYHNGENVVNPTVVNMGIFRFSLQQLYVSVICLLVVTPVNILIAWMFKKSKTTWHKLETLEGQECSCCRLPLLRRTSDEEKLHKALIARGFHSDQEMQLPHVCIYIAWTVVFLCVALSAFFLFLYSQQWGKAKAEEWLTSFLLSFIESLLVVDPLKVLILAALFALFIRKPDEGASEGFDKTEIKSNQATLGISEGLERHSIEPLSGEDLKNAQTTRHKETKAFSVMREIILYIVFLFIVYTIGYSNRDNRSFLLYDNMLKSMVTPQHSIGLSQVHTTETFFHWVNQTVFPTLFEQNYYQGSRRRWWERYYLTDWQNYRVGPPRMRQVRSPSIEMCFKKIIGAIPCNDRYYMYGQEDKDFCLRWKDPPCSEEESVYRFTSDAWKFTSYADALSMPLFGFYNTYSGGGYIAELDVNLDVSKKILEELFMELWVDRQTRAVIIEYTVFNANTNMFCYVSLMAEFPETGGVLTYYIIRPFRIYQHTGALGAYIFFNEVIFVIVVAVAVIKVALKFRRQGLGYFNDSWHINEFFCLLTCLVGIAIYIVREVISRLTMGQFRDNPKRYVSFYHITIWDEVLVDVVGFLSFICTVRMIRILGYSKRSSALMQVLKNAGKDLYYFSIMFFLLFFAFAIVAFVIFGHVLADYRDMLVTTATLITCMIGKSPFTEMRLMEPFFAQLYFGSFIFFEVFILLTMFLAILNESITAVRADQNIAYTQHDMLDLLIGKFKDVLGLFLPKRLKEAVQKMNSESPKHVEKEASTVTERTEEAGQEPETKESRMDILRAAAEVMAMKKALEAKQKPTI